MFEDAYRVEQMFSIFGGEAHVIHGLTRHHSTLRDDGGIFVLLPAGLTAEDRADRLAATILRHASARLDHREILALLGRAFRPRPSLPSHCSPESVAAWIPGASR